MSEPADPGQAVRHLLGLERELRRVGHVLEPAAAASPDVRARGLHAVRRRNLHLFDHPSGEPRPGLDEPDPDTVAGNPASNKHHIPVRAPHPIAPEGEVVNGQGEEIASFWASHGRLTIKVGQNEVKRPASAFPFTWHGSSRMIENAMKSSSPTPVGALLTTVLPGLAERLLELRIRREWEALMGQDLARRAQPLTLSQGVLHVAVSNSPWLQELTLREPELRRRLADRYGTDAIRLLRFSLRSWEGSTRDEPRSEP